MTYLRSLRKKEILRTSWKLMRKKVPVRRLLWAILVYVLPFIGDTKRRWVYCKRNRWIFNPYQCLLFTFTPSLSASFRTDLTGYGITSLSHQPIRPRWASQSLHRRTSRQLKLLHLPPRRAGKQKMCREIMARRTGWCKGKPLSNFRRWVIISSLLRLENNYF